MKYHLAQLNIAKFTKAPEHPDNIGFIGNLDKINAIAEQQDGFVWRLKGEENNALDVQVFDDPNLITNISVWQTIDALSAFVYRNKTHRDIMRKRHEWFEHVEFHLVLWWVEKGRIPTLEDAKTRLALLQTHGPTDDAFTFKHSFPAPKSLACKS